MSSSSVTGHLASCACSEHPLPASMRVSDALEIYLRENGFTREAYDDHWTKASFFGLSFKVPNTARHRWAIMLHDLHHVATGYGTDLWGEAEVSAWETRGGLGGLDLYVTAIVASITAGGFLMVPLRTLRAYRAAESNLFTPGIDYEGLLSLTVGQLRERLSLPGAGVARAPRRLHPDAPRPTLSPV